MSRESFEHLPMTPTGDIQATDATFFYLTVEQEKSLKGTIIQYSTLTIISHEHLYVNTSTVGFNNRIIIKKVCSHFSLAAYGVHVARLLKEHCEALKWFNPPEHIPHPMQDIMCRKSEVHPLQASLFYNNEF